MPRKQRQMRCTTSAMLSRENAPRIWAGRPSPLQPLAAVSTSRRHNFPIPGRYPGRQTFLWCHLPPWSGGRFSHLPRSMLRRWLAAGGQTWFLVLTLRSRGDSLSFHPEWKLHEERVPLRTNPNWRTSSPMNARTNPPVEQPSLNGITTPLPRQIKRCRTLDNSQLAMNVCLSWTGFFPPLRQAKIRIGVSMLHSKPLDSAIRHSRKRNEPSLGAMEMRHLRLQRRQRRPSSRRPPMRWETSSPLRQGKEIQGSPGRKSTGFVVLSPLDSPNARASRSSTRPLEKSLLSRRPG